ncbi:MAG: hypothetical protein ACLSIC_14560 [Blautia wexlerae]
MSNKKRVSIDFPIEIYEKLEKQADLAGLKVPTFIRSKMTLYANTGRTEED